jgi:hypothetical protein
MLFIFIYFVRAKLLFVSHSFVDFDFMLQKELFITDSLLDTLKYLENYLL